jgi:hypothetical protein
MGLEVSDTGLQMISIPRINRVCYETFLPRQINSHLEAILTLLSSVDMSVTMTIQAA